MPTDPTAAPGDLDAQAKRLYSRLRKYLKDDFKAWHDGDREALAQTCRWAQRARQAIEALPRDDEGRPKLTTLGSQDQLVEHPNVKVALAAERAYLEGLKELGFTPAARKRLDIDIRPKGGGKFGGLGHG